MKSLTLAQIQLLFQIYQGFDFFKGLASNYQYVVYGHDHNEEDGNPYSYYEDLRLLTERGLIAGCDPYQPQEITAKGVQLVETIQAVK